MSNDKKIKELLVEADRALGNKSIFITPDYEHITKIYNKIANLYKLSNDFESAIKYYDKALYYENKRGYTYEVCNILLSIAECNKKLSRYLDAKNNIDRASSLSAENGDFFKAAKLQRDFAEYLESIKENKLAIEIYEKSVYYDEESFYSLQCLSKIAEFASQEVDYDKAIGIYNKLINRSQNNISKYKSPEYFVLCTICYLCNDDISGAKKSFDKFININCNFEDSREGILCDAMIRAYGDFDGIEFIKSLAEYDKYKRLDPHKTELLLRIKNRLSTNNDDSLC